ncbi:unnamed protein product, partial [marine sediment metagenome]
PKPASYLIEVELTDVFKGIPSLVGVGADELFTKLLRGMHDDFSPSAQAGCVPTVYDPMLRNDIADDVDWQASEVELFVTTMSESLELAERARDEEDQEECVELWKLVFGDLFAEALAENAQLVAELSKSGGLGVTSTGMVSRATQGPGVTPVPKHRFYGEGLP